MVERKIGDRTLRLVRDDITDMEVEAFVYDIRADGQLDSGYGAAITQRGGKIVQEALNDLGTVSVGEAVITTAGKMKAKFIIHANGPKFMESQTEDKLRAAATSALKLADQNGIAQLAFPPMGSGLYQVPLDVCARVLVDTVSDYLKGASVLKEVFLVAIDDREYEPFMAHFN
jgi:O-acetyl-ADP-ribose deacetylase